MCGGFGSLGKNLLFVDTGKINILVGVFVLCIKYDCGSGR